MLEGSACPVAYSGTRAPARCLLWPVQTDMDGLKCDARPPQKKTPPTIKGLVDRLNKEVINLRPQIPQVVTRAPPGRRNAPWCGGSILASLSSFTHMWVSRKEYSEIGGKILDRKCL